MSKFSSEHQPAVKRTKNKLTLVLEAIKQEKLLNTDGRTSKEGVEKAVFAYLAKAAFSPTEDQAVIANLCLQTLIKKGWPDSKPTCEPIQFKYDKSGTASDNAQSVLYAVSTGDIPADVGGVIIGMIKDGIAIKESTDMIQRLEAIEAQLKAHE